MDWFYGFDLGDAESALCLLPNDPSREPVSLPVEGHQSFVTALARLSGGKCLIGERACYEDGVRERSLRFKSRFLTDRSVERDVEDFAGEVLAQIEKKQLPEGESCYYVGCPAGWSAQERERYRRLFERVHFPPLKIVSESRAALVGACQSRHLQVGYDILKRPVLVVDIGSSTTDLAYVVGGKERQLATCGEVALGGGLMDEALLNLSLEESPYREKLLDVFERCPPWRSYVEFAARHLKETYFSDEAYFEHNPCITHVRIVYDSRLSLAMEMNQEVARALTEGPLERLGGSSFKEAFQRSLKGAKEGIKEALPELLFLTGGVAKLPAVESWCQEVFPDALIIKSAEPELSVAKGLCYCGRIDEDMKAFMREVEELRDSTRVEQIVEGHVGALYRDAVQALTMPILEKAVMPVIEAWRLGRIKTLDAIDGELQASVSEFLKSQEARELLVKPILRWLKPVSYELEQYTVPICARHNVPYKALSLQSYLALPEIDFHVETKNVFAVEEVTLLIDTIITLVMGLLCGGGGIALIANGLPGIVAGAVLSLLVLLLGKEKMQGVLLKTNIPLPIRRLLPPKFFESRMEKMAQTIKTDFYESLKNDKNEEISERLAEDISRQIDDCLVKMAKVVEIPLGG